MKKPVWERKRPKGIGKPKALSPAKKASSAKRAARRRDARTRIWLITCEPPGNDNGQRKERRDWTGDP
jgi:hypothetical protein